MQNLTWYRHRLRTMSPAEICWRIRGKLRDAFDGYATRPELPDSQNILDARFRAAPLSICTFPFPSVAAEDMSQLPEGEQWRTHLIRRAARLLHKQVTLFDLEDRDLGPEIDWNYEYKACKRTPMSIASRIDYRDYAETGDCKFVWELNRHQHWVVLARAYHITGYRPYAEAVVEQLDGWIEQCPFGQGMNWRSPLELAIRLINWVWALELIRPAEVIAPELSEKIVQVAYLHLWEISRKYSKHSSANNHLIGEAAGVFIGSTYFAPFRRARQWQQKSRRILLNEIFAQTHADGGPREQAFSYHLFALEFFLLAGLAARHEGEDFPSAYWERLEKMLEFVAAFYEGGRLPMIGDADDGYVLDLGGSDRARDLLAMGAILFNRHDFKTHAPGFTEPAFWLLGLDGFQKYEAIRAAAPRRISSRALADSGYYLLQHGEPASEERISVVFDCGELGFGPIAAHGHADALSFSLRVGGEDILVDPGTYDYFTERRWRDYFRSTRAHNTLVVDDVEQSEMLGLFMWGRRAKAGCTQWEPTAEGGTVIGEHNGYMHLPHPVSHRRKLHLIGPERTLLIRDELAGKGRHHVDLFLHFAETCVLRKVSDHCFSAECGKQQIIIELDHHFEVETHEGSYEPIAGWVSRGYHRKSPATTLIARCHWYEHLETEVRILIGEQYLKRSHRAIPKSSAKVTA